jgi:hypothetical protein
VCHKQVVSALQKEEELPPPLGACNRGPTVVNPTSYSILLDPMVRSCSVGYLDLVDLALNSHGPLGDLTEVPPKRLFLVHKKMEQPKPKLKHCGKSKSFDSSDIFPTDVSKNLLLAPMKVAIF